MKSHNKCFNLINPLSWFLLKDCAKTTPSPSGTDLKVKPMFDGRAYARKIKINFIEHDTILNYKGAY